MAEDLVSMSESFQRNYFRRRQRPRFCRLVTVVLGREAVVLHAEQTTDRLLTENPRKQDPQFRAELFPSQQINIEVARVVGHPEFLDQLATVPVCQALLPDRIELDLCHSQAPVAERERVNYGVEYGDRKCGNDEIEGDGEEHDGGGGLTGGLVMSVVALDRILRLPLRDPSRLNDDEDVEHQYGNRNYRECQQFRHPRPDGEQRFRIVFQHFFPRRAFVVAVGPEVSLDGMHG